MCKSVLKTCCCVLGNASSLPEMGCDVIGVDKGALICHQHGIRMTYLIGDFDSISAQELKDLQKQYDVQILPCRKDVSDSEAAVLWAREHGYERIVLVTSMSGRFDHTYVNFRLAEKYGCELLDEQNHIFMIPEGTSEILKETYPYVSFFAVKEAVVTLKGFAYPLNEYQLKCDDVLCLSNEILKDKAIVETTGRLWCIQSKDETEKAA